MVDNSLHVVFLLRFSHGVLVDGDKASSGSTSDSAMPTQHSLSTGLLASIDDVLLLQLYIRCAIFSYERFCTYCLIFYHRLH